LEGPDNPNRQSQEHHAMTHHNATTTHVAAADNGAVIINYTRDGETLMDALDRAERTWPGAGVMTFLAPHRSRGR
jgi:hypothetical protein